MDLAKERKDISYYLLELRIEEDYYLLCKERALMVWETLEGLQQSLIRTGGGLLKYEPWPIRVTSERFPSIKDLDFNPLILSFTNKEYISEVPFLSLNSLVLIPVVSEYIQEYRMTPR